MIKKFEQFVNESIKDFLKPKNVDDIIGIRDNIYVDQLKCKYEILQFLTSVGFEFDYKIKPNFTPTISDSVGTIMITDFIKCHKKSMPNFHRLSMDDQDILWDTRMDNLFIPKFKEILKKYDFELTSDGVRYGQGDLLLEFTTPHDDILSYSRGVPKVVSDYMAKK